MTIIAAKAFAEGLARKDELLREDIRSSPASTMIESFPTVSVSGTLFSDFLNKTLALVLACFLTFGTYFFVDPRDARANVLAIEDSLLDLSRLAQETFSAASVALRSRAYNPDEIITAIQHPRVLLGASGVPQTMEALARNFNKRVDSAVHAIMFSPSFGVNPRRSLGFPGTTASLTTL